MNNMESMYTSTIRLLDRSVELKLINNYVIKIANNDAKQNDVWRTRIEILDIPLPTDLALIEAYWWVQGVLYTYDRALAISL